MTTMLNSYVLSDSVVEKMRAKIEETRQKNIELGFGLCRLKFVNTLKPGSDCTGEKCSIEQVPACPTGVYIGGYHTHPKGTTKPSISDLRNAYANDVECVGSVAENAIKCYVRVGPREPIDEKKIVAVLDEVEKVAGQVLEEEQFKKWESARDDILNRHFKEVDVQ